MTFHDEPRAVARGTRARDRREAGGCSSPPCSPGLRAPVPRQGASALHPSAVSGCGGSRNGVFGGALGFTFEIALYVRTLPSVDFLEVIFDSERLEGGVRCEEQRVVRVVLFGEGAHVPPLVKPEIA